MTWREWALKYLTEERADLRQRTDVLESGRCQIFEMREGHRVDVTSEAVERNKVNLAEIEKIIAEAKATPDA